MNAHQTAGTPMPGAGAGPDSPRPDNQDAAVEPVSGDGKQAQPEPEHGTDRRRRHKKHGAGPDRQPAEDTATQRPDEQYLRLLADFDNFRKRVARERDEFSRRANERLLTEILPVMDNLARAIASARESDRTDPFVDGINLVLEQLTACLAGFGLAPFDSLGTKFDPEKHEAVNRVTSDKVPEQTVVEELRKGYMLDGKLIRAAQVVVACPPEDAGSDAAPDQHPGA